MSWSLPVLSLSLSCPVPVLSRCRLHPVNHTCTTYTSAFQCDPTRRLLGEPDPNIQHSLQFAISCTISPPQCTHSPPTSTLALPQHTGHTFNPARRSSRQSTQSPPTIHLQL
ncbi:hypothetical protein N7533_012421 [Penicillium manginii]|uniref:uncharacterized protein n=1 Tax=Penicillium manginii TaxID=203109 RepID=UPI00254994CF|nr:uncharacterized protein N7533_012421 [Penicillium manginii]KAJ5739637.1 hypothetical protein N7533_012421 [Penicillium manginii]